MAPASRSASVGHLAVVAGEDHLRSIERACERRGLRVEAYADVEALLGAAPQGGSVALSIDDSELAEVAPQLASLIAAGAGPVLVICERLRRWELRGLLEAGAAGVVLADELASALIPCLEASLAGQVCVPQEYSFRVEPEALSAREKQVLGMVVLGHTNREIASRLFLAESTVKSHLSSAFGKLGVRSRHEAVELILDSERSAGQGILGLSVEQVA